MRIQGNLARACGCLLLLSYAAAAQLPHRMEVGGGISGYVSPPPVIGAPYSAVQEIEINQTLVDGTHIHSKVQFQRFYRDSEGRTRTEHIFRRSGANSEDLISIGIYDPVAGVNYSFSLGNPVAHRSLFTPPRTPNTDRWYDGRGSYSGAVGTGVRQALASPPIATKPPAPPPDPSRPQVIHESLGTQTIEGVSADGHRITTTIPVDVAGNDRPIVTVWDSWFSSYMRTPVLDRKSDPRSGERIERWTNIDLSEPDPSLFQPPANYTIEDQPTR